MMEDEKVLELSKWAKSNGGEINILDLVDSNKDKIRSYRTDWDDHVHYESQEPNFHYIIKSICTDGILLEKRDKSHNANGTVLVPYSVAAYDLLEEAFLSMFFILKMMLSLKSSK